MRAHTEEVSRQTRVKINDNSNRGRTHGSTKGRGDSQA